MRTECFWKEAFSYSGSVTPVVLKRVVVFGAIGLCAWLLDYFTHREMGLAVTPFEFIGVVLGLLLVLRTNSGYDRWYEARKLWGGIVNQSRNLAITGLTYGPQEERWQKEFAKWAAVFPHIVRHSLRGERNLDDVAEILGPEAQQVAAAQHMPMYASTRISKLLLQAVRGGQMDALAFHRAEHERAMLIDHLGACERILKTPLAAAFSIEIRRYLLVYLASLPFAIVHQVGALTPIFSMLIAYPLLSLDQIGVDLQNPFSKFRVSHLPIDDISTAIECNIFGMMDTVPPLPLTRPQPAAPSSVPVVLEGSGEAPALAPQWSPAPVYSAATAPQPAVAFSEV